MADKTSINKPNFFTELCIRGSNDLRSQLKIEEWAYTRTHIRNSQDSRDYYIYGLLDEVEKAGIAMIGAEEFLTDAKDSVEPDRTTRNIIGATIDEQMIWARKLTETLAEVILFEAINEPGYYFHYLLVNELVKIKNTIKNAKDFYGCSIKNYRYQADCLRDEIVALESQIDIQRCWYLGVNNKTRLRVSGVKAELSSFRQRMMLAMTAATPYQRIALGLSYGESYSRPSQSLHLSIGDFGPDVNIRAVEIGLSRIGVLSADILIQCRKLVGDRRRKGYLAQLAKSFKGNKYPVELYNQRVRPDIKKGDFVMDGEKIAEVIKVIKSRFGYRSFRIKYLAGSPLPGIMTEEYPAIFVRKVYPKEKIINEMVRLIKEHAPNSKIDYRQIHHSLRETVVHLWENVGVKEMMFGQRELAIKKMEQELASRKKDMV